MRAIVTILVLLCLAAPATAQQSIAWEPGPPVLALDPWGDLPTVQNAGEKSAWLAGILSFFLPYGTGSFYAGNNGHGVRHLIIGGGTAIGTAVGIGIACADFDLDLCDEDDPAYVVGAVFALGYVVNWVWGTIVAVNDVKAYNRALALELAPDVIVLPAVGGASGANGTRVGLQLLNVSF
jgi:hypothetical protein